MMMGASRASGKLVRLQDPRAKGFQVFGTGLKLKKKAFVTAV
jgi:hypothetical protein